MMSSNETHLEVAIADLIITEGLSFNLSQKLNSRRYYIFKETYPKVITLKTEKSSPKIL